jgi:16S rRNA (cytidine1402-2'-O)-methyltransferase
MAKLYVVATPIGNLGDLTDNMRAAFERCDLIAAEDTRVTMKLLNHLGIKKPLVSCHRHNEGRRAEELVERMLREDLNVCVTSDAGTPAISDPGWAIVSAARAAGIEVSPVVGPSAVTAALSVSGFQSASFAFLGFLPRERAALDEALDDFAKTGIPVFVSYESPHRVGKLLEAVADKFPQARVVVACDLTKKFERIDAGSAAEVLQAVRNNPNADKGEYVVAVELPPAKAAAAPERPRDAAAAILEAMLSGASLNDAADAALNDFPRNEVYRAKLRVKEFLAAHREDED